MPNQASRRISHPQLLAALTHSTRGHLLNILRERTETPKNLALELDCSVRHIEYHLKILESLGCVELQGTERSPGGKIIAHHYRASRRYSFASRDAWNSIGKEQQPAITMDILRLMGDDLTGALLGGTIDEGENHISRSPLLLDAPGYEKLLQVLSDTLEKVQEIQGESTNRLERGGTPIPTLVHIVQFLSPGASA